MLRDSIHTNHSGMQGIGRLSVSIVNRLRRLYNSARWSFANQQERPVNHDWFTEAEVAGYDSAADTASPARIDDQTWRDLGVNALLRELGLQHSIFGRQYLYRLLRRGRTGPAERALYQLQAGNAADDGDLLRATEPVVARLRCVDIDLTPLLFKGQFPLLPGWVDRLWLAPWVLMLVLAAAAVAPAPLIVGALLAYLGVAGWVQIRLYRPLQQWRRQQDALYKLVNAALDLARLGRARPHPLLQEAVADEALLVPARKRIQVPWYERVAAVAEYANLILLHDYVRLGRNVLRVRQMLPDLRRAYEILARCEGGLAVLAHLRATPIHSVASFCEGRQLEFDDLVHPLVKNPVPLTLALDGRRGAFVSGQNGAGKSTLLRAVGLGLMTARALGFCHARRAMLPFAAVCSSMEHADSIEQAESLYMAEMRRARELLAQTNTDSATVFLVDEIFRGTNNIESVSAGAAVVSELARNHLVMISSHNLILAPLLGEQLMPLHVHFSGDPARPITIRSGVMTETNGIDMMRRYGLPDDAIRRATEVFEWFAGYIIQPATYPAVR